VSVYHQEDFTPDEVRILNRFVTNTDLPVFGLINLPEVVKGALFARYSRSPKSLRRLLIDEFVNEWRPASMPSLSTSTTTHRWH
jgi:hypothetical protein